MVGFQRSAKIVCIQINFLLYDMIAQYFLSIGKLLNNANVS